MVTRTDASEGGVSHWYCFARCQTCCTLSRLEQIELFRSVFETRKRIFFFNFCFFFEFPPPGQAHQVRDGSLAPSSLATINQYNQMSQNVGYFQLQGKFSHLGATHDFTRCISQLPATLGRASNRTAVDSGYIHVGDCKSISKNNATITFDGKRGVFLLHVLGKNRVLINGKTVENGSEPVPLYNKTAVRMGNATSSDNNSKFYFLLPLDKPKETTSELCLEVTQEYVRAGQGEELTVRMITEQIHRKYPFFAADDQQKILTRKISGFLNRNPAFDRQQQTDELNAKYGKKLVVYKWVGGDGRNHTSAGKKRGATSGESGSGESSTKRAKTGIGDVL